MVNNILILDFPVPSALAVETIGTDRTSGVSLFNLKAANLIKDLTHEVDPAVTISYTLLTRRGELVRNLSLSMQMLRATLPSSSLRPNMPIPIKPGQVEFRVIQTIGALTATTIIVTLANPLAQ